MASYILRIIAILYVVRNSEASPLFHPVGGSMAARTAGKVFFKGAIIATAGGIAVENFHKSLQDFWNQQLGPNTQMPKAVKDCINANVTLKGGAKIDIDSFIRFKCYIDPKTELYADINFTGSIEFSHGDLNVGLTKGPGEATSKSPQTPSSTDTTQSQGASSEGGPHVGPESAKVASIEDSIASLFFSEADLSLGKKMSINFTRSTNKAPFLPREVVDKLSLDPSNINEIVNQFNLTIESTEAKIINGTLKYCADETPDHKCCHSLESMVEFATSIVGKSVKAISNNVEKDTKMDYKVQNVRKLPCGSITVMCHKVPFPSALFYCLKVENMVVYVAKLEGSDGISVNAPTACHEVPNSWDYDHLVLKDLQAKAKSGPICHFLLDDDVLWVAE